MKKILGLTIAALLVMALVGGGTWAYFSDVETSTGNIFTAGILNLTAEVTGSGAVTGSKTGSGDGVNQYLTFTTLKPGDNGTISWVCTNNGDFTATLTILSDLYSSDENSLADPEDDPWFTGTAESGTTTTLVDTALTQADDFFNGLTLTITAGTSVGQTSVITDYDLASTTITLSPAITAPGADSVYEITDGGDDDEGTDLDGELDEYMGVILTRNGSVIYGGATAADYKPLSGLEAAFTDALGQSMASSAVITYALNWDIAADLENTGPDGIFGSDDADEDDIDDNVLQSDDVTFDVTFTLTGS